ncbi:MAG TPA: MFS transporter [Thermoleophilia bacterium]|nr:MFS transporter [Thermoleophilia bacterium]
MTTLVDEGRPAQSLTRDTNFLLLAGGQFVSQMGDRLAMVAFPWLVYSTTRSALSTGAVLALFTLPYVLFGGLAGGLLDRIDKRGIMVAADIVRAGLVLAVPVVAERSIAGVFVLAFLTSCATVFFDPGLMALVPEIVPEPSLLRANSVLSATNHITEIVGYAAAGLVVFYLTAKATFAVDAGTFAVSAVTLLAMTLPGRKGTSDIAHAPDPRASLVGEIQEGAVFLWRNAGLRANTLLAVAVGAGVGALYPLSFLLAMSRYGGTRAFGMMECAIATGFLLGSIALGALAKRIPKGKSIIAGLIVMGLCCALTAVLGSFLLVLVDFTVLGFANGAVLISIDTYVQSTVPAALRGRVWGVRFTLTQGVYALGVLVAGALAATVGLGPLFGLCGLIVLVPALIGLFLPVIRDV